MPKQKIPEEEIDLWIARYQQKYGPIPGFAWQEYSGRRMAELARTALHRGVEVQAWRDMPRLENWPGEPLNWYGRKDEERPRLSEQEPSQWGPPPEGASPAEPLSDEELSRLSEQEPSQRRPPPEGIWPAEPPRPKPVVFFKRVENWFQDEPAGTFLLEEDYNAIKPMYEAIRSAKTWRELRAMMPENEFEKLHQWDSLGGEFVYKENDEVMFLDEEWSLDEFIEHHGSDNIIEADDSFDPSQLWGYDDGDYPPFLLPYLVEVLPRDFCEKFGSFVSSYFSGSWWEFPSENYPEMRKDLEERGYKVTFVTPPNLSVMVDDAKGAFAPDAEDAARDA